MPRRSFDPQDFGIDLTKDEFVDRIVDAFNDTYKGNLSVDELLLHPREALRFLRSCPSPLRVLLGAG